MNIKCNPVVDQPDIHIRVCELIILKSKTVNEIFTHLLHLVVRKHLQGQNSYEFESVTVEE